MTDATGALIGRWDTMSEHYLEARETLLDSAVAWLTERLSERDSNLVELGSGPGTLLSRLVVALPSARLTGVEIDPVLRRLHELGPAGEHANRVRSANVDLSIPRSVRGLEAPGTVVVAVQVLHYFDSRRLDAMLREIGCVLAADGVLVHLDHVPPSLPSAVDSRCRPPSPGDPWGAWWVEAGSLPCLADASVERRRWLEASGIASAERHPDELGLRAQFARAGLTALHLEQRIGRSLLTVCGSSVGE